MSAGPPPGGPLNPVPPPSKKKTVIVRKRKDQSQAASSSSGMPPSSAQSFDKGFSLPPSNYPTQQPAPSSARPSSVPSGSSSRSCAVACMCYCLVSLSLQASCRQLSDILSVVAAFCVLNAFLLRRFRDPDLQPSFDLFPSVSPPLCLLWSASLSTYYVPCFAHTNK